MNYWCRLWKMSRFNFLNLYDAPKKLHTHKFWKQIAQFHPWWKKIPKLATTTKKTPFYIFMERQKKFTHEWRKKKNLKLIFKLWYSQWTKIWKNCVMKNVGANGCMIITKAKINEGFWNKMSKNFDFSLWGQQCDACPSNCTFLLILEQCAIFWLIWKTLKNFFDFLIW